MVDDKKSTLYCCEETGVVKEKLVDSFSMFITATPYEILYKSHLSRFKKHPLNIYGLPFHEEPQKIYQGVDREGIGQFDQKGNYVSDEDLKTEIDLLEYMSANNINKKMDVLWIRSYGDSTDCPQHYEFLGYDISYEPSISGTFSIICDCLFICRWHGCDPEGTLFVDDFNKLNENGLFSNSDDAYQYMVRYLKQDWTERGEYYILEVFGKK